MTPAQCIAARKLLDWSARELATRSGHATTTITAFETAKTRTNPAIVRSLEKVLSDNGIVFVPSKQARADARAVGIDLDDKSRVELRV